MVSDQSQDLNLYFKSISSFFLVIITLLFFISLSSAERQKPVSRFNYDLIIDKTTLPKEIICEIRQSTDTESRIQTWIRNPSNIPFQTTQKDALGHIVRGTKLVDGKVYGYYQNGVPVEGGNHLKGWVVHEEVDKYMMILNKSPEGALLGMEKGLADNTPLPADESVSFFWDFGGKEWIIKGKVVYSINKSYDAVTDSVFSPNR